MFERQNNTDFKKPMSGLFTKRKFDAKNAVRNSWILLEAKLNGILHRS
jgi:hypothetical protein